MPSEDGGCYVIGRCNCRIRVFNKSAIKTCSGPYQRHDKCLTGGRTCSSSMQHLNAVSKARAMELRGGGLLIQCPAYAGALAR